jgi:hypothetical protein
MMFDWATMLIMTKPSPRSEAVAARCTPELMAKLDELREVARRREPGQGKQSEPCRRGAPPGEPAELGQALKDCVLAHRFMD